MADGAPRVFRSRTIIAAGVANLVVAVGAFAAAAVIETRSPETRSSGAASGAPALVVLGLLLSLLGAARLTARLEVHDTYLVWVSFFKPNKVPLASLTNASLNPGSSGGTGVALVAVADPELWGFDLVLFTLWRLLAPTSSRAHVLYLHWEDGRMTKAPAVCTHRFTYSYSDAAKAKGAVSDAIVHFHQTFGGATHTQWGAGGVAGAGVYGQGGWDSVGVDRAGGLPPGPAWYGPDPATGLRPQWPRAEPDHRPGPYAMPAPPVEDDTPPPFVAPGWASPPAAPPPFPVSSPPPLPPASAPPMTGQP